mmetsp:Transcript_16745/g.45769  ORF Transcript_16745/g.45769 Transcript_16745/m.45769 type:complete len:228 (+) Transcript_16745:127-810(+)
MSSRLRQGTPSSNDVPLWTHCVCHCDRLAELAVWGPRHAQHAVLLELGTDLSDEEVACSAIGDLTTSLHVDQWERQVDAQLNHKRRKPPGERREDGAVFVVKRSLLHRDEGRSLLRLALDFLAAVSREHVEERPLGGGDALRGALHIETVVARNHATVPARQAQDYLAEFEHAFATLVPAHDAASKACAARKEKPGSNVATEVRPAGPIHGGRVAVVHQQRGALRGN